MDRKHGYEGKVIWKRKTIIMHMWRRLRNGNIARRKQKTGSNRQKDRQYLTKGWILRHTNLYSKKCKKGSVHELIKTEKSAKGIRKCFCKIYKLAIEERIMSEGYIERDSGSPFYFSFYLQKPSWQCHCLQYVLLYMLHDNTRSSIYVKRA